MRERRRTAAVALIGLAVACGGADRERRAEPALRIWTPILVWWDAGRPRRLDFAIENPTDRTVALAAPDPANTRVELYGPESYRLCGVAPLGRAAPGARVALAPGDRWPVHVDLDAACGAVPAGEWRYEIAYRSPEPAGPRSGSSAEAAASTFTGTLAARYGQIIVSGPSSVACEPSRSDGTGARQGRAAPAARGRARSRQSPAGPRG